MQTPPACTGCARNMGDRCLAMEQWEPDCWAHTADTARVRRELRRAVQYCRLRKHHREAREVLGELTALGRRWAGEAAYERLTKGA